MRAHKSSNFLAFVVQSHYSIWRQFSYIIFHRNRIYRCIQTKTFSRWLVYNFSGCRFPFWTHIYFFVHNNCTFIVKQRYLCLATRSHMHKKLCSSANVRLTGCTTIVKLAGCIKSKNCVKKNLQTLFNFIHVKETFK